MRKGALEAAGGSLPFAFPSRSPMALLLSPGLCQPGLDEEKGVVSVGLRHKDAFFSPFISCRELFKKRKKKKHSILEQEQNKPLFYNTYLNGFLLSKVENSSVTKYN